MSRSERFGSDAQNALERRFVLDPLRDPARLALDLVDMRDDQRPYVIGRRAAWLSEVIGPTARLLDIDILGCPAGAVLQALLLHHGWPIVWSGILSDLMEASLLIDEMGEHRVVAELQKMLGGNQT